MVYSLNTKTYMIAILDYNNPLGPVLFVKCFNYTQYKHVLWLLGVFAWYAGNPRNA